MKKPLPETSKERQLLSATRQIFASEGGKLILEFLQSASFYDRPTFLPTSDGKACPLIAAQNDGRRALFLELKKLISRANREETETAEKP